MKIILGILFSISILCGAFPDIGYAIANGAFVPAQAGFLIAIPFCFTRKLSSRKFFFILAYLIPLFLTFVYFGTPNLGILYLFVGSVIGERFSPNSRDIKFLFLFAFLIFSISIILSLYLNQTPFFLNGDANYTAFLLSMLLAITGIFKPLLRIIFDIVLSIFIFFTFSRTGFLFLITIFFIKNIPILKSFINKCHEGKIFSLFMVITLITPVLILNLLFKDRLPYYVYTPMGIQKYSLSSLIDHSNYYRIKALAFFIQDQSAIDVFFLGAPRDDYGAVRKEGKTIKPHHFLGGMLFEFGVFVALASLLSLYKRKYWLDTRPFLLILIYGSILGFGSLYGFAILYLRMLSNTSFEQYFVQDKETKLLC